MIIQHNITAMNSHRQLSGNNSTLGKNLEKLSSGYRINRAGDDAAGLSISEKMRAQIKGLETSTKNAKDGISLIQTAEGALTEVHSMIDRMATLATQSANGTYNADQRQYMQDELNKLLDDVDRIADGTNFNGTKLLDGTLEDGVAATKAKLEIAIDGFTTTADKTGTATVNLDGKEITWDVKSTTNAKQLADGTNTFEKAIKAAGMEGKFTVGYAVGTVTITAAAEGKHRITGFSVKTDSTKPADALYTAAPTITPSKDEGKDGFGVPKGEALILQVGDMNASYNQMTVKVGGMSTKKLGINELKINTQSDARAAIEKISKAKEGVSSARSAMGALQNRLEHVINNLGVATENMADSESRIRDVDMAHEMMAFTKNNILTQAAQSMLAQANQLPQGVLQLLR